MRRIRTAACLVGLTAAVFPVTQGSAAGDLCGKTKTTPEALYRDLAKDSKLREMARSDVFVAMEDSRDGTLWTFTLPAHPAHPTVVCRRIMERRGVLEIPTAIECKGAEAACAKLRSDFDILNERVIQDLYAKQKPQPK
jgi:hypothetical protein